MAAPKLRFKEFDGDWTSNKLKQLTDVLKCGVASTPTYVDEGGYPFLSAQNVSRDGLMDYSKVNNISAEFYKKISKTKLLKGDILYSRVGASYGVASIFDKDEDYGVYVSLTHIRANKDLDNVFLKLFLNSPKARVQAERGVFQGGGVQNLNVGVVEEFELSIPSKPEQTKIASFLSNVDEKISQLTQKHQLLSQYKQCMMQKLFSQQVRFKADDGSEFGEWELGKLSDLAEIQGGFAFKSAEFGKGNSKVLRIGDIQKNIDLDKFNGVNSLEVPDSRYRVFKESIVMALSGATFGKLGKVQSGSAFINQRVATFVSKNNSMNDFLYQIMLSQDFYNYIQSIPSASAQPNISNQDVMNYELNIPSLAEQTKIANFLSAIDQKIEVVAQQIEQAKTWKKGLLQQMFV